MSLRAYILKLEAWLYAQLHTLFNASEICLIGKVFFTHEYTYTDVYLQVVRAILYRLHLHDLMRGQDLTPFFQALKLPARLTDKEGLLNQFTIYACACNILERENFMELRVRGIPFRDAYTAFCTLLFREKPRLRYHHDMHHIDSFHRYFRLFNMLLHTYKVQTPCGGFSLKCEGIPPQISLPYQKDVTYTLLGVTSECSRKHTHIHTCVIYFLRICVHSRIYRLPFARIIAK